MAIVEYCDIQHLSAVNRVGLLMLGTRLEKVITRAVIGISSIHCTGLVYISEEKGSLLDHRRNQKERERVIRIRERKEKKRSRACVHCISLLIHLSLYNLLE